MKFVRLSCLFFAMCQSNEKIEWIHIGEGSECQKLTEEANKLLNENTNVSFKDGTSLGGNKNSSYSIAAPTAEDVELQKLIALFQYTYIGSPMVYYGDEAGMFGADDPDDRKPMIWPEFTYDDEASHPFNKQVPVSKVNFNKDLYDWYKKIGGIRNSNEAIKLGDYKTLYIDNEKKIFVFARFNDNAVAIVAINRGDKVEDISLDIDFISKVPTTFTDALSEQEYDLILNKLSFLLEPLTAKVLVE